MGPGGKGRAAEGSGEDVPRGCSAPRTGLLVQPRRTRSPRVRELGGTGLASWGGRTLRSPASYPAVCAVVSRGLLCSLGPDRGRAGSWLGAGRVGLADGFEGAEEGTVVIHGVPCPRERGETGSGQRSLPQGPELALCPIAAHGALGCVGGVP